jgi:hypothetical protein
VTNLRASRASAAGSATLRWTEVGDDWWVGKAKRLELRWATARISDAGFSRAHRITLSALASGTVRHASLTGLVRGKRIHFAARAIDDAGNAGLIARTSVVVGGRR